MPITPFGWKDHGPPDLDAANLEGANSHAGAYTDEVVAAEIAEAAGEAQGLATLDSESHLTASQVPLSVVTSSANAAAAGQQIVAAAASRAVKARKNPHYDVRDFGIIGNGADETAKYNTMIEEVSTAGG